MRNLPRPQTASRVTNPSARAPGSDDSPRERRRLHRPCFDDSTSGDAPSLPPIMNREDQDHVDPSARRQPRRAKPHQPRPRRTSVFATPNPPTRRPPTHKGWPPQSSESSVRAHRHQYPDGRGARSVSASQPHEKNRHLPPVTTTHQVLGSVPLRKPGGTPIHRLTINETQQARTEDAAQQEGEQLLRESAHGAQQRVAAGHKRHEQRVVSSPHTKGGHKANTKGGPATDGAHIWKRS